MQPPSKLRTSRNASVLLASRVVVIGCGYATYVVVARAFSTAEFGVYGVIAAIINVLNTVVGTGTNQAISRLVSRHPEAAAWILTRGLWWSAFATFSLAMIVAIGAPYFASLLLDASLGQLLVIAAAVPGMYAFNAAYAGFLNGMGALARQGFVNMALAVARFALIGLAATLGYGVAGTLYAAIAAALAGAVSARWLSQIPSGADRLELRASVFLRMMVSFVGVSLLLQLLLANDVLLVKRLMPAGAADEQAGIYTAAQSIARIPYFLLLGVSQIVYPRLSAPGTGKGLEAARRTSSLVLSGMIVILSGILALCLPLTNILIRLIYPARYADGGLVLGWLLGASAALTLAESSLTMLSGAGGPRRPASILAAAVIAQIGLGLVLVPRQGLIGAAQATLCAGAVAATTAAISLRRVVGTAPRVRLLATTLLPTSALMVASTLWAQHVWHPAATLAFITGAYASYLMAVYCLNACELKAIFSG